MCDRLAGCGSRKHISSSRAQAWNASEALAACSEDSWRANLTAAPEMRDSVEQAVQGLGGMPDSSFSSLHFHVMRVSRSVQDLDRPETWAAHCKLSCSDQQVRLSVLEFSIQDETAPQIGRRSIVF